MNELLSLSQAARSIIEAVRTRGLEFVPASPTDEPPVEAEPPDSDRARDDANFRDDRNRCYNVEPTRELYISFERVPRSDLFVFFLDGSLRTCYWGDILTGERAYPVMVSQVVVSVVERRQRVIADTLVERRFYALFPFATSDAIWTSLQGIAGEVIPAGLEEEPPADADLRQKLGGKARERLHFSEAEVASNLNRRPGEWLVLDGDLRDSKFSGLQETIGIAKSFSLKPRVSFQELALELDLPRLIRELPLGCRTPVLGQQVSEYRDLVFWYQRLWPTSSLDNYLQGVVKVETRFPPGPWDASKTELVQRLSAAVFAERLPCAYPERRWHAHIYPIRMAEELAKSVLLPPLVLRQMLFHGG